MNRFKFLIPLAIVPFMLAACSSETEEAAEDAQQAAADAADAAANVVESMADDAGAAMGDAAAAAGQAMDDAGDAMGQAMDAASDAASQAMDDAGAAIDQAMDDAGAAADQAMANMSEAADEAMAGAGAMAASMAGDCALSIEVGDNIAYSTDTMTAPAACAEVTVTITHTGNLPAVAMGHNWVLVPEDALQAVAQAGQNAGADANYVPDDDRIIAATSVVGGGESASVTFSLDALQDGVAYRYVCTFPGHWAVMQGTFSVSG